jgi:SHAQKYF class myb-like DNA-binding protein
MEFPLAFQIYLGYTSFYIAVIRYGKDWKKVEDYVGTRTGSQVRSHAQKYFIKIVKIMRDRKKLKGRKIPDITDTEKELN